VTKPPRIVDTDSHYAENIKGLWKYMNEPWRSRTRGRLAERYLPISIGDRFMDDRIDRTRQFGDTDDLDPGAVNKTIEECMAALGVAATLLVPNKFALIGHLSVREMAVALCNAHIDYHLNEVADAARGIYTLPVVSWHDPEAGAAMIDRVADNPAVAGVCLMTSHTMPPWGDVRYNPIYEACVRHGLPVVMHGDSGMTLTEGAGYADGFQSLIESHSIGFLVSNEIQLTSMIFQGVAIRYPELKIVFLESGLMYVPMMMYRLDEYFLKRRAEAPLLEMPPSEYVRRHFWFGTQPIEAPRDPRAMEAIFEMADGRDRFVFASDYPHWDYDDPITIDRLSFLSREDKAKVFALNALGVFRFEKGGKQPWQNALSDAWKTSGQPVPSS
jgi:uncharacterized protein